ncbi:MULTISPECIES: TonB-dependent receptor plug domain-containing protein [unclassified Brevundimonas]|uniref:TonB-dependent receptor plug domain-containing protein n=1 Tax=unclassified Brevundimonas TaxID=2622653 RepID=UPI0025BB8FFD|nr:MULTISPECIES: TonB-dependent receptor [unclassified Brevundimonas]
MTIKRERLLATTMIAGLALAGFAAPAMAQTAPTAPAPADQASQVEDVVVTGSRIRQPNLTTTSPVTQVTGEDIDVQGVTRVEDLVTQLPQAFAAQNSTVSNGASGTATVSLRNLGSSRTLVLIDGKRMGYGSPLDDAADLNQIPGQMVERVEVLTGGASAVYGSDAIAGVVNFIMRRDFEGIEIDAQYGFNQHNNDYDGVGNVRNVVAARAATNPSQFKLPDDNVTTGFSREVNILMGVSTPDDRGNITAYAGYRKNNKVLGRDYDYSSCSLGAPAAATPNDFACAGSGTSFPGQFTNFGSYTYTVDDAGNFIPYVGARDAYNFGPLNYYQRPDERYTLGAFGHYDVNDKIELYTQLMFSDYSTIAQIAPSGNFFGEFADGFRTTDGSSTIRCNNPLLSAQQRGAIGCSAADITSGAAKDMYIGRRNVEGGGRQSDIRFQSYRGVIGARGDLNEAWSYDLTAQYSRAQYTNIYRNEFSNTRLARALDVVTDPVTGQPVCSSVVAGIDADCVPYNIFRSGGVTQEALDYLQVPLLATGWTTQQVVSGSLTADLGTYGVKSPWATRGVQAAFGVEYRRDALDLTPDVSFTSGDGAGQGGPTLGLNGANQVYDVFAEAQIPIAEGMAFADQLSIDLAYRHSEYDLGGGTDSWKIGGDWAPVPSVRFRASAQRAVRAPNVIELFTAQGFNLFDLDADPCDKNVAASYAGDAACIGTNPWQVTLAQATSTGISSPAGQYNFLQGGNTALTPEESDTLTLGVVFTPEFLPGFNLTLDYFDIQIDNLISSIGAQNSLDACYTAGLAAACSNIQRNSNGQLWIGTGNVVDLNTNIGGLSTSGLDVAANYRMDLADFGWDSAGTLGFTMVGTWLQSLETDTGLGFDNSKYDCAGYYANQCGVPNPEWRHRARIDWGTPIEGLNLAGTWRYYGGSEIAVLGDDGSLNNSPAARIDREFDAINYFDLAATWQARDNVNVRVGVNNVFDTDPPLSYSVGTTGNNNTYPQLYNAMGRYVFFGVTANF